jgi:hypothetical protein
MRDLVVGKRTGSRLMRQDDMKRGFLGWHENGYLPHRDEPGLVQFVTFRLTDAFPAELRSEWEALLKIEDDRKRRTQLEAYLDKGRGECHLRRSDVAAVVEGSLLFRHDAEYELRGWAIMPNHVHIGRGAVRDFGTRMNGCAFLRSDGVCSSSSAATPDWGSGWGIQAPRQ